MLLLLYKFKKIKKIEKNDCFCIFLRSCRHIPTFPTFSADVAEMISSGPSPTLSPTRHIQHWFVVFKMKDPSVPIQGEPGIMTLPSHNKDLTVNCDTRV
jgi:hypothetical protein